MWENIEKPIFTKSNDNEGRTYITAYAHPNSQAVVSIGEKNVIIDGTVKLELRVGKSQFGEQIIFSFIRDGKIELTKRRTKFDIIEFYLPKELGIDFIKKAVEHFEQHK